MAQYSKKKKSYVFIVRLNKKLDYHVLEMKRRRIAFVKMSFFSSVLGKKKEVYIILCIDKKQEKEKR